MWWNNGFFYHHHPPPHKPIQPFKEHKRCILTTTRYSSPTSLYQFYILHCVYIERKKDKGEEKIMASCIRGGEIKRRSSRSLSKFRLTLHPLSLIPYFTYFQVLEQVEFWGNSSQSCDLNIYERGYKITGIQFLTLGHNIFSVFRNRWSKK